MDEIFIDTHAFKHGVTAQDIAYAWSHFERMLHRGAPREGEIAVVGYDRKSRLIEMVGVEKSCGILIYHAMRPPTRKMLAELGMTGGRK